MTWRKYVFDCGVLASVAAVLIYIVYRGLAG